MDEANQIELKPVPDVTNDVSVLVQDLTACTKQNIR